MGKNERLICTDITELERAYKWDKGKKNQELGKVNRPPAVSNWIGRARGSRARPETDTAPKIASLAVYEREWWKWWAGLQPAWRAQASGRSDRFSRTAYPPQQRENWHPLRVPGQNGVLSIVASLYWWGLKNQAEVERENEESWAEAVADVKWMLQGML
ncbi:hypothetical protein C8F04DRAFT_932620, partial [Mycena alexandri]